MESLARHSEILDELVVYRPEYGNHGLWVRPKQMFLESVVINGQTMTRFACFETTMTDNNLLRNLPTQLPEEVIQTILTADQLRIERIISHGHASAPESWYDQDQAEWVLVLTGAARVQFEEEVVEMRTGDFINIPAHKKHRVDWTTPSEPTIWLAIFYGERE